MPGDMTQQIQAQVKNAFEKKQAVKIQAGNSKHFLVPQCNAERLDVSQHQGIISYEPTELVITARAGTRLSEIQSTLDESKQILAFEPPHYAESATLGGTIACNLSGPMRAYTGAARDFVLGCEIINGKAEQLKFGGQVMKNVAGYDASRLMCGAMGTLGIILNVSLKVLPKPEAELTLSQSCDINQAISYMHQWRKQSLPISASCYKESQLTVRLSGNASAVDSAGKIIAGNIHNNDALFWQQIREQSDDFFNTEKPLWRLSLASNTPPLELTGETLYEWGGALRWLKTQEPAETIRQVLQSYNGHASLYKNNHMNVPASHPLSPGMLNIHKRLKHAFDPEKILNPGYMQSDI